MNSTGSSLIYSTYLGGSSNDSCSARCSVTVDADGSVYLLGNTSSSNFPTTSSAYDQSYNGSWDLFITKINPGSGGLLYSTFLGSSGEDIGRGIAVVNSVVLVVGDTSSASFPITSDAFQSTYGGNRDAFVTFLSPDNGGVIYSTFIGGSGIDAGGGFSIVGQALEQQAGHPPVTFLLPQMFMVIHLVAVQVMGLLSNLRRRVSLMGILS